MTETAASAPRFRVRPDVIALLMGIAFISHFNRVSMATAADVRIMRQYGISAEQMGAVYSAFLWAYTIAMIPGGFFIDRFRPRRALGAMGLASAFFVALTGLVGVFATGGTAVLVSLLVIRACMGVVSSPLHPACAAAVRDAVPAPLRSRTNGLVTGAALVGIALTPLVFGELIDWFDWPVAFWIASGTTAAVGLGWLVSKESPRPAAEASAEARASIPWSALCKDRGLLLLTASYGAVGYFQYLFFYWMNYYFQNVLHLPVSTSRTYAAFPPLAMAVGMPLGGWLSDGIERSIGARRGRAIVPMAGMTAGALLLGLAILATEPAWVVAWISLAMGAVGMAEGPFWVTAIERGGRRGGSSAALFNTGGNAGGALAPYLTPWVGERFGWGAAIGLGGVICFAGVLLWLGIDVQPEEDDAKPAVV